MKLVGFSGKIGHGKDMAAEMFQYIQYKERIKNGVIGTGPAISSFSEWEDECTYEVRRLFSGAQIEKYGGKLKDMVCILLNCTREQLEDREFKEKSLGPKWKKYVLTYTDKYSDFSNVETFLTREEAQIFVNGENCVYFYDIVEVQLTPRLLLQLMGTDCGRQILHPNIWVNATLEPYLEQLRWINADSDNKNKFNDWVISDVRFPNEVEAMEELGGIAIRIERDSIIPSDKEHESETALDNYPFTYVLKNNGTKEELLEEIYKIYKNKYQ